MGDSSLQSDDLALMVPVPTQALSHASGRTVMSRTAWRCCSPLPNRKTSMPCREAEPLLDECEGPGTIPVNLLLELVDWLPPIRSRKRSASRATRPRAWRTARVHSRGLRLPSANG